MPESAPVAFQAVVKLRQVSSGIMFCELRGLVDLIYNEIRLLFRFDLGTQPTLLGKPKLITLADALCNQKP